MRLLLALSVAAGFLVQAQAPRKPPVPEPPPVPREFRGMWVASVGNIDWPTRPNLSVVQQQAELRALLDTATRTKLNVVLLQVRPGADALYESALEPWSEYLTGQMGRAPNPKWDPLKFACDEAHARGLELHAWMNPFRARSMQTVSPIAPSHIVRAHREWVIPYGRVWWTDPGSAPAREHILRVAADIVRRYDIDGLHVDDYFYPYPVRRDDGTWFDFPDDLNFGRYRNGGGRLARSDWRRDNINRFIEELYAQTHRIKPAVKVGISPFGIWRPDNPPGIKGLDQYAVLYSDARMWLREGWCDYLAPQLYWPLDRREQAFQPLLRWWSQQNPQRRLLVPGLNSAKIGDDRNVNDTLAQIRIARQEGANGVIFWNASSIRRDFGGLASALPRDLFAKEALVPATPWLGTNAPAAPELTGEFAANNLGLALRWTPATNAPSAQFVLQARFGMQWLSDILPGATTGRDYDRRRNQAIPDEARLTPIGRTGVAGEPAVWLKP